MNKSIIIGNLTRDPELRTTQNGISVCSFTVAVNRRRGADKEPQTDFFRVSAWRQLGETCQKYLAKGRKVYVAGPVSVSTYKGSDGSAKAQLEITADEVEFLTPKAEQPADQPAAAPAPARADGFVEVTDQEELPF